MLGFNDDHAGRMAAHRWRRAALSWCGELLGSVPRRPPPCAAAVRRAAAAWCGGFPRARCARFLLYASSPAIAACAVQRARRAARALEDVKKVLTDREHGECPPSGDARHSSAS